MSDKGEEPLEKPASECKENDLHIGSEVASPSKRKVRVEDDEQVNSGNNEHNKRRKSEDNPATASSNTVGVKKENPDGEVADEAESSSNNIPVNIKAEPVDATDDVPTAGTNSGVSSMATNTAVVVKTEAAPSSTNSPVVKTEPTSNNNSAVADSSVSSSTLRPSCRFGIRCYRRNPAHRQTEAHPGDSDYRRPSFPTPPLGTPPCAFGNACYRRNPVHFQQFSHPPDFNSAQNIRKRLRQRRVQSQNANGGPAEYSDLESDEEEDPFYDQGDSDLDYNPDVQDDNDDEDDELEFNSERQDCDLFD